MKTKAAKHLKALISINQFKEAIEILQELSVKEKFDKDDQNEIIGHSSTYNDFSLKNDARVINTPEFRDFKFSLIEFIDHVDKLEQLEIEINTNELRRLRLRSTLQSYKKWIIPAMWLIAMAGFTSTHFQYKTGIDTDISALVTHVGFISRSASELYIKQPIFQIDVDEFTSIKINARTLSLRDEFEDTQWADYQLESGQVNLQPIPDDIAGATIESVNFDYLRLEENTEVSLHNLESKNHVSLYFNSKAITAGLIFQDSVNFYYSYANIANPSIEHNLDENNEIAGIARVTKGTGSQIGITGNNNLVMNLEFKNPPGEWLDQHNITIDSLSFVYSEDSEKFKSTVEEGSIQLINDQSHVFKTFDLGQFDFLKLEGYEELTLSSLDLDGEYLRLELSGKVDLISSGTSAEDLTIQNPTLLMWHLKNNPILLTFIVGGLILLSIAIHLYFKASLTQALPKVESKIS